MAVDNEFIEIPSDDLNGNKQTNTSDEFIEIPSNESSEETIEDNTNNDDNNNDDNTSEDDAVSNQESENNKGDKSNEGKSNDDPKDDDSKTDTGDKKTKKFSVKSSKSESTQNNTDEPKATEVSEENVVSFLKTKLGINISNLKDLAVKQELPEEVEEYLNFKKETNGRNLKDYFKARKDWSNESDDKAIKEMLRLQYPHLSDELIDEEYNALTITEDDRDTLTSSELSKKERELKKMSAKAKHFMTEYSSKWKAPLDNAESKKQPEYTEEQYKADHEEYWERRDKSLENYKSESIDVEGLGKIDIPINEEIVNLIKDRTENTNAYFKDYLDDKGIFDTEAIVTNKGWSIPEVRNYFIEELLTKAHTKFIENEDSIRRNRQDDDSAGNIPIKESISLFETGSRSISNPSIGQPKF